MDMASIAKLKGWNIGRRRWSSARCGRARVDCTGHFSGIGRANSRTRSRNEISRFDLSNKRSKPSRRMAALREVKTTSASYLKLFLLCSIRSGRLSPFISGSFSMDRVQPGYVQLILHDDKNTPKNFVIGLLRSVFSLSPTDAFELMVTIEKQGQSGLRHVSARSGRSAVSGCAGANSRHRAINCR